MHSTCVPFRFPTTNQCSAFSPLMQKPYAKPRPRLAAGFLLAAAAAGKSAGRGGGPSRRRPGSYVKFKCLLPHSRRFEFACDEGGEATSGRFRFWHFLPVCSIDVIFPTRSLVTSRERL